MALERFSAFTGKIATPVQPCSTPPAGERNTVKIRASVFFDGTFNNRLNVADGKKRINKGGSYVNEVTNIAVLEKNFHPNENYTYSFPIYVEGVGTTDHEEDSSVSAATGQFRAGIIAKVEKGVREIIKRITIRFRNTVRIELLDLDVFGFSRGAAAARNFVHCALTGNKMSLKAQLGYLGFSVGEVKVIFVGLFDTVAAYGISHRDDTHELHLDAIRTAERVVQLAAAEEYRKNFRLTNINSARHGIEIYLPGAHSDIGGGYVHDDDELEWQLLKFSKEIQTSEHWTALQRDKRWLLEHGWYLPAEFHDIGVTNVLKTTRRGISNRYSRIPLDIMAGYASSSGVKFKERLNIDNEIPEELQKVRSAILENRPTSAGFWIQAKDEYMKYLRHRFLHFSAHCGAKLGANDPQFANDDPINGRRQRVIQNG